MLSRRRSDLAKLKERKAEEDLKAKKEEKKEEEPRRGQLPIPKDPVIGRDTEMLRKFRQS